MAVNKIYPDAAAALTGILKDGTTVMAGGFGLCGIPTSPIEAIRYSVGGLTVISNNAGIDCYGLAKGSIGIDEAISALTRKRQ